MVLPIYFEFFLFFMLFSYPALKMTVGQAKAIKD